MSVIPLHDLDEVATKGDLAVLRAEIADLRAELKGDIAALETSMAGLRVEFTTELGVLRKTMSNWMLTLMISIIAALIGVGILG